jgi:NAD(P)-dependent dehydrogenase (short-subunit alcohol dehydrogenase family)
MATSLFDLSGKTAVVTGASRGLGRAIALALSAAGATLCVTARSRESLTDTCRLIEQGGGRAHAAAQDVRDLSSITAVLDSFRRDVGHVDILVNNAGHEHVKASTDVDELLWDEIVDTNLRGAFFWSQAFARHLSKHERAGCIVNLCSLTSYVGVPTAVPYTSSKSGLLGMTKALATEWAAKGVRVNAIAPGYFRTAMTDQFYESEDWQSRMLSRIPQLRFGRDSDIGGAVVFLCSDAAAYVTGHCLPVDGGFLASI